MLRTTKVRYLTHAEMGCYVGVHWEEWDTRKGKQASGHVDLYDENGGWLKKIHDIQDFEKTVEEYITEGWLPVPEPGTSYQ